MSTFGIRYGPSFLILRVIVKGEMTSVHVIISVLSSFLETLILFVPYIELSYSTHEPDDSLKFFRKG